MALVGVLTGWFHDIEFIAEDLGYPTPEVTQLLADSRLPGMKVLEFAFDSRDTSSYLPHSYGENCICYTGTHDNAPLALWRTEADKADIAFAVQYLGLNDRGGLQPRHHPRRHELGGKALRRADAGLARPRRGPPHEHPRHEPRQLGVAYAPR